MAHVHLKPGSALQNRTNKRENVVGLFVPANADAKSHTNAWYDDA